MKAATKTKVIIHQNIEIVHPPDKELSDAIGVQQESLEAENAEYHSLIETEWSRPLTASEATRLESIKANIDYRDMTSEVNVVMKSQIEEIHSQLDAIRKEVEAFPGRVRTNLS